MEGYGRSIPAPASSNIAQPSLDSVAPIEVSSDNIDIVSEEDDAETPRVVKVSKDLLSDSLRLVISIISTNLWTSSHLNGLVKHQPAMQRKMQSQYLVILVRQHLHFLEDGLRERERERDTRKLDFPIVLGTPLVGPGSAAAARSKTRTVNITILAILLY